MALACLAVGIVRDESDDKAYYPVAGTALTGHRIAPDGSGQRSGVRMTRSVFLSRYVYVASALLLGCALLPGQSAPSIRSQAGVVNAANYAPADFPGGAIAQGSIFVVFGTGLGPTTLLSATSFPLQTTLGGVSITVTQGATTVNAIPVYVYATQVAAIMPSNAPLGAVQVTLTYNNVRSAPAPAQVTQTDVALFTVPNSGSGPGAIQNFVSGPLPTNSLTSPAKPGQVVILWATGLGPVQGGNDTIAPVTGTLPVNVGVYLGNQGLSPSYSGRSGCCAGEDEIVFTLPPDAPLGCHVPVQIVTGDGAPSNVATIAISADGGPCSDSVTPFGTVLTGKTGTVLLTHVTAGAGSGAVAVNLAADLAVASFRNDTDTLYAFSPLYSLPPLGTCNVYLGAGNAFAGAPLPGLGPVGAGLDAGAVTVNNGHASQQLDAAAGFYADALGYTPSLFFTNGSYTVSASGGADIGPFSVQLGDPPNVTWTTASQSSVVTRSAGLAVNWTVSGGDPSKLVALIMGGNADTPDNRSEVFLCAAQASAGTFTVPAAILSRVPATRSGGGSMGLVGVGMLPSQPQATIHATGLDYGLADSLGLSVHSTTFQ